MQDETASVKSRTPLWERLNLSSFTVDSLYALGFSSLTAGQLDRAEKYFLMLCLLDAEAAHGYLGYGICYAQRGRMMMAAHLFQRSIQCAPDWPVPYYHLARAHVARKDQAAARASIDRFLALRDDSVPASLAQEAEQLSRFIEGMEKGGEATAPLVE